MAGENGARKSECQRDSPAIIAKGLLIGCTLMAGAFIAKRFVLKMDAARFRLLMDGLMLVSGLTLLWAAIF